MLSRRMQCAGLFAFAVAAFGAAASDVETIAKGDDSFVIVPGERRDPFTFRRKIETPTTGCYPVLPPVVIDDFNRAATRLKLSQVYDRAENAFMNSQLNEAMLACDEGLGVIQGIPQNHRDGFGDEQNSILRLRAAVNHQLVRDEAQRQFDALNISLTGVVARTGLSQAIVNSRVVTRGEIVSLENAPQNVLVLEIRQNEVIFLYRGFRMNVPIKDR